MRNNTFVKMSVSKDTVIGQDIDIKRNKRENQIHVKENSVSLCNLPERSKVSFRPLAQLSLR